MSDPIIQQKDFPFEEIKDENGDFFNSARELLDLGYVPSQIWSIVSEEGEDGKEYFVFGPSRHYVNLIGFIATEERHDGRTYYEELVSTE